MQSADPVPSDRVARSPGARAEPRAGFAALLALAVAVAACYAGTLRVPFLLDDPLPDAPLAWTTRPLVAASFALNRAWSGDDTWSWHVVNALFLLACARTLLGVLRAAVALAAPAWSARAHEAFALVVTLAWTCHPLLTSAVTYVSQRAELMGTLAYLLVLLGHLRSVGARHPKRWQAIALAALALGFLAKEIVATAPLAVLLVELVLVPAAPRANLRRRAGFHALLWLVAALGFALQIGPLLFAEGASAGFGRHEAFGPLDYLRSQPAVILHYLRLAVWPHPLVFDYGWPVAREPMEWVPQTLVVVALLAAALRLLLRRRWEGLALALVFLVLAPTSSIVPIKDLAFEHRMVLPLAPVLVLVAGGLVVACARLAPASRRLPLALGLAAVVALAVTTVRRNREYRTAIALWTTVVERAPGNPRGHVNLAAALIDAGRIEEAEAGLLRALELDPRSSFAHRNLAAIAADRGDVAGAIAHLDQALAHADSAVARADLARLLAAQGRADEALEHLRRARALEPDRASVRLELGKLLLELERPLEAAAELETGRALAPGSVELALALADARERSGDPAAAQALLDGLLARPDVVADRLLEARVRARLARLERAP